MNYLLVHIKTWLLIGCILADSAAPVLFPEQYATHSPLAAETEKDPEPFDAKKEGKSESEKIFNTLIILLRTSGSIVSNRFFEKQNPAGSQVFLPVITPPPKLPA
jgi:hypothetical protein